ncbi:MAG TPA: ATP-binding cassette domain-containing protein [Thermoanaerobaculia bacterium]|jgi:ABC-2 type transport system ATP-binding protein|nr:ATP-binding cassette domain-containing protein [Thermoanaerobaculia bacterium]
MDAIEVEDLHKTYAGGVQALRGISFAVQAGEVFALLGPNGAGKSTTVRILTTLSAPTSGRARVAGFDVIEMPREVRRRIGYVAQASGVDITGTGRENLTLQGHLYRLPAAQLRSRVEELLHLFQLEAAADRPAMTYSGGMKRRLDVAMGLVHSPEVLFLDEPTTGLDPESRAVMWKEVRRLAEGGLTLLLTTHYLEEADQLAQRLAIVDGGRIVAEGTPEELKGQLRGDVVSVDLTDRGRLSEAELMLRGMEDVSGVVVDGPRLYAHVSSGARAVPALLAALERAGLAVSQVSLSRPSLDDVYLTATGHAYHEEGAATAARR